MPSIIIAGVTYDLPEGEGAPSKVNDYNEALIALAGIVGDSAAWSSWTPTWTNLTISGSTVTAKYIKVGRLVICRLTVVLGANLPSGLITFTLPVTAATYPGSSYGMPLGNCNCFDASATPRAAWITLESTTKAVVAPLDTSGTYAAPVGSSATIPFAWATGDELHANFCFESAA